MKNASLIVALLVLPQVALSEIQKISVQNVIDALMTQGLDRKIVDLTYQKSELPLMRAQGLYDWTLTSAGSWELSKFESLTGLANPEDRTRIYKLGFSKKTMTGTTLGLDYSRTYQDSILNSFTTNLRPPSLVQDQIDFSLRQDMLNNFFGVNDRARVNSAESQINRAKIDRVESLEELVLRGVRVFWDAYLARESLKEQLDAREKYRFLVRTLERKSAHGFDDKGELAKARAELTNYDRAVKSASLNFLNILDQLFLLMNQPPTQDVEFIVPDVLPEIPVAKEEVQLENLRKVRASQMQINVTRYDRDVAKWESYPMLSLVGRASSNGVEETADLAFSEMNSNTNPKYYIGLEFAMKFDSQQARGELANKEATYQEALTTFQKSKSEEWDRLEKTSRALKAKYIVAKLAQEAVVNWQKVITVQERNFRVGRISTAELIQDYNMYYRTYSSRSTATADYHFAIQEYLAARDLIIKSGDDRGGATP